MKKTYISTVAVFIAAMTCVTQSLAAAPSITVKSDKSDVAYTYTSSNGSAEATADALKLFDSFQDAAVEAYTSANLTITSESNDSDNVEIALRFSTDKAGTEYSVLDYYDFRITNENGDIIYDSDNTEPTVSEALKKDISFGVFNTESESDTKKFTVEYKIDEASSANIDEEALGTLSVNIVSQIVSRNDTEADYSVTITAETPEIPEVVDAAADSRPSGAVTADKKTGTDSKVIEYQATCGKDISAGRYTVTGKGILKIVGADGTEKSTTVIKDSTVPDIEGVTKAIVTITDGDVITALPLEGDEKPSIKFEKTTSNSTVAAPASRADAASDNSTPAPGKSNPKTGEESARAVVLGSVMFTAAAAIFLLEIIKRKKDMN